MEAQNWLFCPKGWRFTAPQRSKRVLIHWLNRLLSLSTGEELTEEAIITLPENVIMGSARGAVSVLGKKKKKKTCLTPTAMIGFLQPTVACAGDIMGRALKNLDGMLRMPYGCGEQNMALLAPNIYILQYLDKTKQLTPAVREKAVEFLRSGEALGGDQCRRDVPLSDPSPIRWVSVLRVSEAAELQALQRRLQHIRSRRGQHLVRTRLKPEQAAKTPASNITAASSSWFSG